MRTTPLRWGIVAVAAFVVPLMNAAPASAHESREVGPYNFVVGWYDEPAFANQPNGPEVTITNLETEEPVVEDVELEVEIIFGGESITQEMEPAFVVDVFGDPGNYDTNIFPTRPGTWSFHFTGTVEGEEIDEEFTSGEETFSDIEDPAAIAFPVADPNNAQLADRVVQEASRLDDDLSLSQILGYAGIGLGAVALLIALMAWRRRGSATA